MTLSTLFGTEGLDAAEKKALVFTDSVQDAAHRAGFVESRSHVLTQRSVLRAAVGDSPIALDALVEEAIRQAGDDRFQRFRLVPPELAEREEFSPFWKVESARDVPPTISTRVRRRLLFDATLEFGLQSRVGRTLEQTGSVAVEVEAGQAAKLAAIARAAIARSEAQDTLDESLASMPDSSLVGCAAPSNTSASAAASSTMVQPLLRTATATASGAAGPAARDARLPQGTPRTRIRTHRAEPEAQGPAA